MSRLLAIACLILAPALASGQPLPRTQLSAGLHLIQAEVADNFVTRMQGLMQRQSLGANDGMLFVFDEAAVQCMWMKNTLIPLSVAFIDSAGAILNIADMQPHSEQSHCAVGPARYALEMNQGWFAAKGLRAGAKLRGLDKLKPRQ